MPDFIFKLMNAAHRLILKVSGGRLGWNAGGMPVVTLTTIGRKSGEPRPVILTSPIAENGSYVLVASKGGHDAHPAWFVNLRANPSVTITREGVDHPMTARILSPEEKAVVWPRITSTYKGYAGYQSKTERDIPVVICEPRS